MTECCDGFFPIISCKLKYKYIESCRCFVRLFQDMPYDQEGYLQAISTSHISVRYLVI
jgi:hypothetical protein